jgi:hypothetical protein
VSVYEPIFKALNDDGVRYVVVGGLAVVLHGYARLTVDLDLVVDLVPEEALKAVRSLGAIGLQPRLPVDAASFADPQQRREWVDRRNMKVFQWFDPDDPLRAVDVFVEEPIPFNGLWDRSLVVPLESTTVRIASREDLIHMKAAAGRPQDLDDIAFLEGLDDR